MVERAARKQETRRRIADTAFGLFSRRGFDAVTVAEVAAAAGVTEKTVFNHFRSKEDLVYSEDAAFETALLDAVRDRPPGEPALTAAERFLLARYRRLEFDRARRDRTRALADLAGTSPALREREQRIHARYTDALAALIAAELRAAADDLRPRLVAEVVVAVHRETVDAIRRAVLSDLPDADIARRALRSARAAFRLLHGGFGSYATKGRSR